MARNGRKLNTVQVQIDCVESMSAVTERRATERRDPQKGRGRGRIVPREVLELSLKPWILVIQSNGRPFIHNIETKLSYWSAPNEEVLSSILELDRAAVLDKIALARSSKEYLDQFRVQTAEEVSGDGRESKDTEKSLDETTQRAGNDELEEEELASESETESESDAHSASESSSENNVSDSELNDLLGSDEDMEDEPTLHPDDLRAVFYKLFEQNALNPYGIWDTELKKIADSDEYLLAESDKARRNLFEDWSKEQISKKSSTQTPQLTPSDTMQFLIFVRKNINISKTPYYLDFKRAHRKHPQFQVSLTELEKENIFRSLASLLKKPKKEQVEAFKSFLASNKAIQAIKQSGNSNKPISYLELPDSVTEDPHFYVFPIKEDETEPVMSLSRLNKFLSGT